MDKSIEVMLDGAHDGKVNEPVVDVDVELDRRGDDGAEAEKEALTAAMLGAELVLGDGGEEAVAAAAAATHLLMSPSKMSDME